MKTFKILFLAFFALVSTQSAGQQQLFLNQTGGAPPTAGLLDQYKGAAFAAAPDVLLYSTYSATDDIAGSLTNGQVGQWSVAVFRDFDDAIKSFTPAEVADGTANTWVQELGPSDGFVRRWYDQSVTVLDVSNLNHADQSDPTKMPKLFDSATGLILENGKAAIDYTTSYTFLRTPSFLPSLAQPNHFFVVYAAKSLTVQVIVTSSNASQRNQIYTTTNSGNAMFAGNELSATTTDVTQGIYSCLFNQNLSLSRRNGIQTGLGNVGLQQIKDLCIGGFANSDAADCIGTQQILVLYNSNQTTNETAIETAINNEYNIY